MLLAGRVALRHELGPAPFALPEEVSEAGTPWHARGSLLALDFALARLSLRRTGAEPPAGPPRLAPRAAR